MPDTLPPPKRAHQWSQAAPQTPAPPGQFVVAGAKPGETVSQIRQLLRSSVAPVALPTPEALRHVLPEVIQRLAQMVDAGTITDAQAFDVVRTVVAHALERRIHDRVLDYLGNYGQGPHCDREYRFCFYERVRPDR